MSAIGHETKYRGVPDPAAPGIWRRLDAALMALSPGAGLVIGLVLIGLVATIDVLTGSELSFSVFYLGPVFLVGWYAQRRHAIAAAALAGAAWFVADRLSGARYGSAWIPYWNAAVRTGIFLVVTLLTNRLLRALTTARELSRLDPLTGVANARYFSDIARVELYRAARYGHAISLVYVDVDDFKLLNDTQGHRVGDEVLRALAEGLHDGLRTSDLVARLGGDEFAVLLPETPASGVASVLNDMRSRLASAIGSVPDGLTLSIGVVTFERPPADFEEMVDLADRLMYEAKMDGKDRFVHKVVARDETEVS